MANVRIAAAGDIQGLLNCHATVWESLRGVLPTSWIEDEIERLRETDVQDTVRRVMEDRMRITLVAEDEEEVVGFAMGRSDKSGLSWLSFMGVTPTYRRRGIGRELAQKFIEESRLRGAYKVSLNTAPELEPAVKLYVSMGFVPEGFLRRHRYGVDLIIYSIFLE